MDTEPAEDAEPNDDATPDQDTGVAKDATPNNDASPTNGPVFNSGDSGGCHIIKGRPASQWPGAALFVALFAALTTRRLSTRFRRNS